MNICQKNGGDVMTEPIKDKSVVKNIMKSLEGENQRNAIMFGLGIYCGFRISDILNLKVKDVRRKWNLKIKQQKTGKMINIPLNRELKKLIDEYTEDMKDDDYLIKSRKGINQPITRTQAYRRKWMMFRKTMKVSRQLPTKTAKLLPTLWMLQRSVKILPPIWQES